MTLTFEACTDVNALRDVMHAAFARYNDDPIPSSALAETTQSLNADLAKGWLFYQARKGNEIVGTVKTFPQGDRLYFGRLSVLPEQQGKGVGKFLVSSLADTAHDLGYTILECKVRQSEHGNIAMYRNLGFLPVSEEVTVSTTGQAIPTVTMHRTLETVS